jgi:hypothetical protein
MTPKRLDFLIKHGFRRRREASFPAHYKDAASFLGNRWARVGERAP